MAAQMLGQAYVAAYLLIAHNRAAVEHVADVLIQRREMHGDEVVELLDSAKFELPDIDLTEQEDAWPSV